MHKPILWVEDDPLDVACVRRVFAAEGIDNPLVSVPSGEEAMLWLQAEKHTPSRPLLVLLDLRLSSSSGFAVLAHVRGDPALATVPVIVMCGSNSPDDIAMCYELGTTAYLVKPAGMAELVREVKALVHLWAVHVRPPPE